MTDLVETIAVEGVSKSKQICYQSIQEQVQITLNIFPIYIHQPGLYFKYGSYQISFKYKL